ncbi:MAG TPA: 2Fe-2S iron-sulfur cluster-binding protein [Chryseosolibacter sp.]
MPLIVIENWKSKTLTINDTTVSLLKHFQNNRLDWMHSCGGKGRCTTCKVIVLEGHEHLSQATPAENRYRAMGALRANERLSCQVRVLGDVKVAVPEEYKLPHIEY